MTIWKKPAENDDCIYSETEIENIIDCSNESNAVMMCCKTPDIIFCIVDESPVSDAFLLQCQSCKRKGDLSGWSWEQAIAEWNVSLWNPKYHERKPFLLADKIESLKSKINSIQCSVEIGNVLTEIIDTTPDTLRSLVIISEANRLSRYIKKQEEYQEDESDD